MHRRPGWMRSSPIERPDRRLGAGRGVGSGSSRRRAVGPHVRASASRGAGDRGVGPSQAPGRLRTAARKGGSVLSTPARFELGRALEHAIATQRGSCRRSPVHLRLRRAWSATLALGRKTEHAEDTCNGRGFTLSQPRRLREVSPSNVYPFGVSPGPRNPCSALRSLSIDPPEAADRQS